MEQTQPRYKKTNSNPMLYWESARFLLLIVIKIVQEVIFVYVIWIVGFFLGRGVGRGFLSINVWYILNY